MNYEAARFWFELTQLGLTTLLGVYVYITSRERVTTNRIQQLESEVDTRLDEHAERLSRVEEAVRQGPSHDDIGRVHHRLDLLSGELKQLIGEFKGTHETLRQIQAYLLQDARR
ncbi:hypothetical protein [Endothiovibrio diazotrophicus]